MARAPKADPDAALLERLKAGDESAFMELVERYHGSLVRLAQSFVASRAVAEEVAQDTWIGVLNGIGRFEGRSSLKTWIFRILVNRARTRGAREARVVPFSSLEPAGEEPSVDPDRFLGPDSRTPGGWAAPPPSWEGEPEQRLLAGEARGVIDAAIAELPVAQRQVITLRDIDGYGAEETRELLEVSDGNQRVLLHRARAKVRQALEDYFGSGG
jgi:RNA polymerase sigma-70 factor (ECF subfamily)